MIGYNASQRLVIYVIPVLLGVPSSHSQAPLPPLLRGAAAGLSCQLHEMSTNTKLQRLQLLLRPIVQLFDYTYRMLHVDQGRCTALVPGQQHSRQVVHVHHGTADSLVQALNTHFGLLMARSELRQILGLR
jgi:hypothetical protein